MGNTASILAANNTRPFSVASLLYLAGTNEVTCVDYASLSSETDVALGVSSLLSSVLVNGMPNLAISDTSATDARIRKLIADFDVKRLFLGNLSAKRHKFGIMFSGLVLEHVVDLDACLALHRKSINLDGLACHAVDLRDHRYHHNGKSKWQFTIDRSDILLGYISKLRYLDFLTAFRKRTFL
jgi:hypothetical protein